MCGIAGAVDFENPPVDRATLECMTRTMTHRGPDEEGFYLDGFDNLFPVGRNGMHKYNNQDHSMLTAMLAVENVRDGRTDKSNLWAVNTEEDYHEEK